MKFCLKTKCLIENYPVSAKVIILHVQRIVLDVLHIVYEVCSESVQTKYIINYV